MIAELSSPLWPSESIRTQLLSDDSPLPFPHQVMTNHRPDPELLIKSVEVSKAIDRLSPPQSRVEYKNLPAELRLLTAWLDGMEFSEVSIVVGIDASNLRRILHGKLPLNRSKHSRIERVLNITRLMRSLIDEKDIGQWYRSSIPSLKNASPLESLRKHKIAQVERLVESYFDPSYA